jgi:sporulation protein YlmC with PRC-barrel domain
MKKSLVLMSIVICALSRAAFAQEPTSTQSPPQPPPTDQPSQNASSKSLFRASHLLGKEVQNFKSEPIGQVEDLIITTDDTGVWVVISLGGLLGLGDKLVAVPYEKLQIDFQKDVVVYKATQEELEQQPSFEYQKKKVEKAIKNPNK